MCLVYSLPYTAAFAHVFEGIAHVALKDAVFQPSTPMRHMAELGNAISKQLLDKSKLCVVTMYRDGGPDHNCKHLSVQMALLAFFIYMGLDTMVVGRTAPQQSWGNEAERVMSVLNLGLQGCALSRTLMDAAFEKVMATCGGMNAIRKAEHESRNRARAQQQQQRQQKQQPANNNNEDAQLADNGVEEAQLANNGVEEAQLVHIGNAEAHMADSGDAEAQPTNNNTEEAQVANNGVEGAQPIDNGVEEVVQYTEEDDVMDMVSEDSGDPDFVPLDGDATIDMCSDDDITMAEVEAPTSGEGNGLQPLQSALPTPIYDGTNLRAVYEASMAAPLATIKGQFEELTWAKKPVCVHPPATLEEV